MSKEEYDRHYPPRIPGTCGLVNYISNPIFCDNSKYPMDMKPKRDVYGDGAVIIINDERDYHVPDENCKVVLFAMGDDQYLIDFERGDYFAQLRDMASAKDYDFDVDWVVKNSMVILDENGLMMLRLVL